MHVMHAPWTCAMERRRDRAGAIIPGSGGRSRARRRPTVRSLASPRYTRLMTRTYVAVIVVEVVVLAALWLLSRHFAA